MRWAEWLLRALVLLFAKDDRADRREMWCADLRDAPEVGLTRVGVLWGMAAFALRQWTRTLPARLVRACVPERFAYALIGGSVVAALLEGLAMLGVPTWSANSETGLVTAWGEVLLWCALALAAAFLVRRWSEGAVILLVALSLAVLSPMVQAALFGSLPDVLQVIQSVCFLAADVLLILQRLGAFRRSSSSTSTW